MGVGGEWGRDFVFKDWAYSNEHQDTDSQDKLLWAVGAVVISGKGPRRRAAMSARLEEDMFLHSAFVSGRREGFPGPSEELWLILAV